MLLFKTKEEVQRKEEDNKALRKLAKFSLAFEHEIELSQLNEEIKRLRKQLEDKQASEVNLHGMKKRAETCQFKLREFKDVCQRLDNQNQKLSQQVKRLEQQKKGLRERLTEGEVRSSQDNIQLRRKLKLKEGVIVEQEKTIGQLKKQVAKQQSEIVSLRRQACNPLRELKQKNKQLERLRFELERTKSAGKLFSPAKENPIGPTSTQVNFYNYQGIEDERQRLDRKPGSRGFSDQDFQNYDGQFQTFQPQAPITVYHSGHSAGGVTMTENPSDDREAVNAQPTSAVTQHKKQRKPRPKKNKGKPKKPDVAILKQVAEFAAYKMLSLGYNTQNLLALLRDGVDDITISQLFKMFQAEPFFVTNQQQNRALIEYFFDTTDLQPQLVLTFEQFQQKFTALFPNLVLFGEEEQGTLAQEVIRTVGKNKQQLAEELKHYEDFHGMIESSIITKVLRGLGLSQRHIEFVLTAIVESSEGLHALNGREMLAKFGGGTSRERSK